VAEWQTRRTQNHGFGASFFLRQALVDSQVMTTPTVHALNSVAASSGNLGTDRTHPVAFVPRLFRAETPSTGVESFVHFAGDLVD
jgi:hypothetical protein